MDVMRPNAPKLKLASGLGVAPAGEPLVDHIDHICHVTGSARHVGLGSDLDGAFGREQTAADLESIADLATIRGLLGARGYSEDAIAGIESANFLRFLREALPV